MNVMLILFMMALGMIAQPVTAGTAEGSERPFNGQLRSLTITDKDKIIDDDGKYVWATAESEVSEDIKRNHRAFTKALQSIEYDEILIPAGRYYFDKQIEFTHKANGMLSPKKIIRGSNQTT